MRTSYLFFVAIRFAHEQGGCLAVQRVGRVGIEKELWKEHLENVEEICMRIGGARSIGEEGRAIWRAR